MKELGIDSQKLVYHPKRVNDWLEGKKIYPIYVEISLTSACNFRCLYCAPKFFLEYKPEFMDVEVAKKTIKSMSEVGVKAIMFGGEGEPLLHPNIVEIVKYAKELGVDVAITTNGVLFRDKILTGLLSLLSWIKFSVDAGEVNTYVKLHGARRLDFKIVLDNISRASFLKRRKNYNVAIGVQSILFKENIETLPQLAKMLKYLKPDYFVVKPYSKHEKSCNNSLEHPTNEQIEKFLIEMHKYRNDYEFIYRDIAFSNVDKERQYDFCYGQDFVGYIDTLGGVYSCINFIGNPEYCYGNIYKDSFENIWKNKKTINPDIQKCRTICRLDNINIYLWNLKKPVENVNFI